MQRKNPPNCIKYGSPKVHCKGLCCNCYHKTPDQAKKIRKYNITYMKEYSHRPKAIESRRRRNKILRQGAKFKNKQRKRAECHLQKDNSTNRASTNCIECGVPDTVFDSARCMEHVRIHHNYRS